MFRNDLNVYLSIISHARTENVAKMRELVGPATWFVGVGEGEQYRAAGADHVVESGPLCRSRNAALDCAAESNAACIELSDDLTKVQIAVQGAKKLVAQDVPFATAVSMVLEGMARVGAHLGGAAPTSNPFYGNVEKPINLAGFVVGDFIIVSAGCSLRFEESMTLKEDYDYTLQHFCAYGRVARRDDVMMSFLHRKNKGGAVAVRTAELEQQNISYLKARWGSFIVDNPRRPNEVLLKLPRVGRV